MAGSTARGLDRHVVGKIQPSGGQVTHTHTHTHDVICSLWILWVPYCTVSYHLSIIGFHLEAGAICFWMYVSILGRQPFP
jgi:hypothetical protein